MPPKKTLKLKGPGKMGIRQPRVILRPLRADSSGHSRYRYTTHAPPSSLFNKPEFSDIKLKIGDQIFYAHRLILCSASDVFSKMLDDNWLESRKRELTLQEDEDCVKIFDLFLYFFYSGSIVINESYVIPLFMLADKYNVILLYSECVKVIENGLKVYVIFKTNFLEQSAKNVVPKLQTNEEGVFADGPSTSGAVASAAPVYCSSSSYTDSSDSETANRDKLPSKMIRYARSSSVPPNHSSEPTSPAQPQVKRSVKHLVASETFPLSMVMKMLILCQDERISKAALYNLEARLCNQILHENFGVWNELPLELLIKMLEDDHFYCDEYTLFSAAKSWLTYTVERQTADTSTKVLANVRFPLLSSSELYRVEKDDYLSKCPDVVNLVREAIRYQLFKNCTEIKSEEKWYGVQFQCRRVKDL